MRSQRSKVSKSRSRRAGSVGVELAVCLPLLVLMGLVLAWVTYAGMVRCELATLARGQAWRQRELVKPEEFPLDWTTKRKRPEVVATASQIYELKLLGFAPIKAESTTMATPGTTWDSESVPFVKPKSWGIHRDVWKQLDSELPSVFYSSFPVIVVRDALDVL